VQLLHDIMPVPEAAIPLPEHKKHNPAEIDGQRRSAKDREHHLRPRPRGPVIDEARERVAGKVLEHAVHDEDLIADVAVRIQRVRGGADDAEHNARKGNAVAGCGVVVAAAVLGDGAEAIRPAPVRRPPRERMRRYSGS
jgi:hypothetical protein